MTVGRGRQRSKGHRVLTAHQAGPCVRPGCEFPGRGRLRGGVGGPGGHWLPAAVVQGGGGPLASLRRGMS